MSINNNGVYSLSRDAQDIIAGLKSKLKRTETELAERTAERDRARRIAVALEQELAAGVWGRIDQAAFEQGLESGEVDHA